MNKTFAELGLCNQYLIKKQPIPNKHYKWKSIEIVGATGVTLK